MKIVLAPDSFKGSMTALEVCDGFREGVRRVRPDAELVALPMADGGEGTTEALVAACGGERISVAATGPLPDQRRPVDGLIGLIHGGSTAVIEMACVSGLPLIPVASRNPLHTTSYGTGQLIGAALDRGARRLIVGIGGSATNDLGVGMAQALGIRFFRADGREMLEPITAEGLAEVARIDPAGLHPAVAQSHILVACDVDNPLLGPDGCSAVYGAQKGADAVIVGRLEALLGQAIDLIEPTFGRRVRHQPGAGAAGGLGAGLIAFLGAELRPGIDLVMEACGFTEAIRGAQLVLTGEGRIDQQTLHGKTIRGVLQRSQRQGVPVVAIVGSIGAGAELLYGMGLTSIVSLVPGPVSLQQAMDQGREMVADTAERVMRLFLATAGRADQGG
ncbi:glycerate kinase [Synechococcus sp. CS-1325]|uniref:glycerate kinase n=1 Tax=Synechococcus sp. CS-1325 TaxID=2847979 RepID=UPI000DB182BA|nr:glycerate kinase [Synechococcus sp. CS-1325]MCT0200441.1 glycerate kinase [Synechococcus sp. CS-1325]PZV02498.1 MAG: glycerate kinase [Cyanobium sp.]